MVLGFEPGLGRSLICALTTTVLYARPIGYEVIEFSKLFNFNSQQDPNYELVRE